MQPIVIGASEQIEEIRRRLDSEFCHLKEEGIGVSVDETNLGNLVFLGCNVTAPSMGITEDQVDNLFRHYVANALSDIIVDTWEKVRIRKIIRANYYYFTREEQEMLVDSSVRNLASFPETPQSGDVYRASRKSRVFHKLLDYFDWSNELVLDGFITFRLKEYTEELEDAVDQAVDDFLMEREYREFIRLLKYFVDVQEPRFDHVHVLMKPDNTFKLVDGQRRVIHNDTLEEFVVEMVESEINYEDLLVSALITLAPQRISIHCSPINERDESVEIIKSIFGDRAEVCHGCSLCLKGEEVSAPVLSKH